jgi:hypothetical protein
VFGLEVWSELPIENCVIEAAGPGRPETRLIAVGSDDIDDAVEGVDRRAVLVRNRIEGGLGLGVYACANGEYLFEAPGHGRYVVSPDGAVVRCAVEGLPPANWQRALLGQVLPLSATLRGMELIHASAVVIDGRAFAFWGPSGAGKSSIGGHLVALGAVPLTDDALALEATAFGVHAHPGPRRANIYDYELDAMANGRARLGAPVARLDKVQLDLPIGAAHAPLAGLFVLDRTAEVERFEIEELERPDPRLLLGTAFVPYVTDARRLRNQFQICHQVASTTRVSRLRIPLGEPAARVARAVAEHAGPHASAS